MKSVLVTIIQIFKYFKRCFNILKLAGLYLQVISASIYKKYIYNILGGKFSINQCILVKGEMGDLAYLR